MREGIYEVEIMHVRAKPARQRFKIRGYTFFTDVARFDAGGVLPGLFHRFRRGDFSLLRSGGVSAVGSALGFLRQESGIAADAVYLLANPRILGYVFNPVSFFFFYRSGAHVATVVEVNNTFGEQKHFVMPSAKPEAAARKDFYVSPFISPFAQFKMRIAAPTESLDIGIHTHGEAGAELVAEMYGEVRPLTGAQVMRLFFKYPLHTVRVIVLIHWFALRLLLRRVPFFPKATADAAVIHQNLRSQG